MSNKVIARYLDGRIVKGIGLDVDAAKPRFHIRPAGEKPLEVRLDELKALFFVKSLEGNPEHHEKLDPIADDPRSRGATTVYMRFADGEVIVGLTIRYPPNRPYFFVVPVDKLSNNIRILVNRSALVEMEPLAGPGLD